MTNGLKKVFAKLFKKEAKKIESKIVKKPEGQVKEERIREYAPMEKHEPPIFVSQVNKKKWLKKKAKRRISSKSRRVNRIAA
jgi:hypothetical protein